MVEFSHLLRVLHVLGVKGLADLGPAKNLTELPQTKLILRQLRVWSLLVDSLRASLKLPTLRLCSSSSLGLFLAYALGLLGLAVVLLRAVEQLVVVVQVVEMVVHVVVGEVVVFVAVAAYVVAPVLFVLLVGPLPVVVLVVRVELVIVVLEKLVVSQRPIQLVRELRVLVVFPLLVLARDLSRLAHLVPHLRHRLGVVQHRVREGLLVDVAVDVDLDELVNVDETSRHGRDAKVSSRVKIRFFNLEALNPVDRASRLHDDRNDVVLIRDARHRRRQPALVNARIRVPKRNVAAGSRGAD